MNTVYALYIQNNGIKPKEPDSSPGLSFPVFSKYPLIWLDTTVSINLSNIIYDKRSTYTKFKNQKRYYKEFMELFKFLENNDCIDCPFSLHIKSIETGIPKEILDSRLSHHLLSYRVYHGSNLILTPEYRVLLDKESKRFYLAKESENPVDARRERLNAKSKRYYDRNKEKLKEKRDAKKASVIEELALIENTAQV
jgi:hypothetical protein